MSMRHTVAYLIGAMLIVSISSVGFSQSTGVSSVHVDGAKLELIHDIEVAAQTDGMILQLFADEGQAVPEGAPLLKIDARVAMAEVAVAKKELEAAQKQAEQTADIEYAKASHLVSSAEFDDIEALYKKNAASFSELRRSTLEKEKGRLAVGVAEIKHQQDILAAGVAGEKVNAAQVRLGMYDVLAPVEGMVVERLRDRGEWVRAGEPIFKFVHLNQLKVKGMVPVNEISPSELLGATMKIKVRISPDFIAELEGVVEYVSPIISVDEVLVWTKIQNQRVSPNGPWMFSSGMHADVLIERP